MLISACGTESTETVNEPAYVDTDTITEADLFDADPQTSEQEEDQSALLGVIPEQNGFVTDNADMLSKVEEDTLRLVLKEHEVRTGNEIVILTSKHYGPYTDIESFVNDVHNAWNLGKAGKENGVLLIINPDMAELRISTGDEVGKILNQQECDRIIGTIMFPFFKANKMYQGLISGAVEMARVLERAAAESGQPAS